MTWWRRLLRFDDGNVISAISSPPSPLRFAEGGVIVAALLLGCSEERLNPVPGSVEDAGVPPPDETNEVPPDAPPVTKKRDVVTKSPFGNVAETQNLLWDGDFEWSSPFTDQYGWIELPASPTLSDIEVGPACRSGVKCARVRKNGSVIGIGVSSATSSLEASIWVRFEAEEGQTPLCSDVDAFLLDLASFEPTDAEQVLTPVAESPDEDGWCNLTATSPVRAHKTYLYVENNFGGPMLLDDCVIRPTREIPVANAPPSRSMSAESRERADAAVRATRYPVDGAPNAARDAYRAFKSR